MNADKRQTQFCETQFFEADLPKLNQTVCNSPLWFVADLSHSFATVEDNGKHTRDFPSRRRDSAKNLNWMNAQLRFGSLPVLETDFGLPGANYGAQDTPFGQEKHEVCLPVFFLNEFEPFSDQKRQRGPGSNCETTSEGHSVSSICQQETLAIDSSRQS